MKACARGKEKFNQLSEKTFDKLRVWVHKYEGVSVDELPPTSSSIKLNILRARYVTYMYIKCLENEAPKLDPLRFGYAENNGLLTPKSVGSYLPSDK